MLRGTDGRLATLLAFQHAGSTISAALTARLAENAATDDDCRVAAISASLQASSWLVESCGSCCSSSRESESDAALRAAREAADSMSVKTSGEAASFRVAARDFSFPFSLFPLFFPFFGSCVRKDPFLFAAKGSSPRPRSFIRRPFDEQRGCVAVLEPNSQELQKHNNINSSLHCGLKH